MGVGSATRTLVGCTENIVVRIVVGASYRRRRRPHGGAPVSYGESLTISLFPEYQGSLTFH
jgi:hypothetical protein